MNQKRAFLGLALAAFLQGCGNGSSGHAPGASGGDGPLLVARIDPPLNGVVLLNQPILVEFTQEVDLGTVDHNSFLFSAYDLDDSLPLDETVAGAFRYRVLEGAVDRRTVEFVPALPTDRDAGGFRPWRRYAVHLPGGAAPGVPVIRSLAGQALALSRDLVFTTPRGPEPGSLYRDARPGGPGKRSLAPSGSVEGLNFFLGGQFPGIRLAFDQPLDPDPVNLSGARIFLEYSDPELDPGGMTRIGARIALAANLPEGAEVTLTPAGLLPSNAEIRVIVERELRDLAGESNADDPAFDRLFGTFRTESASRFQHDALVEEFADSEIVDLEAPHPEPPAEWRPGSLRASLAVRLPAALPDFEPSAREVILDTDFAQVIPKQGLPYTVAGGVFEFRDISIPEGVVVRGQGSNPLVLLATGEIHVRGRLSVDGGAGERARDPGQYRGPSDMAYPRAQTAAGSALLCNTPLSPPGGVPNCGGGAGGSGCLLTTNSSPSGQDGFGPGNRQGGGGQGGASGFGPGAQGAGGGGGSFTTHGDPSYGTFSFLQRTGAGGNGGGTSAATGQGIPEGGRPGAPPFVDSDPENDFFGRDVRSVQGRERAVLGELKAPLGGQGGGGGGNHIYGPVFPSGANFAGNDRRGGGGGAGGGVLILKAVGRVVVHPSGQVTANGGDGEGGCQAGSNTMAGGGAGGSGGMIVIQSSTGIEIAPRGGAAPLLYGVSADGGVGRNGTFSGGAFLTKYPAGQAVNLGSANRGGFGGLGLVQLMAPDPARSIRFDPAGVKPAPVLLPADSGFLSRARSRWIDTGATARQVERPADPRYRDPRAEPGMSGPEYRFAAIHTSGPQAGYLEFETLATGPGSAIGWFAFPELAGGTLASATPAGPSIFRVATVQGTLLGDENRLRGATFQVLQGGAVAGEWTVAGNSASALFLAAAGGPAFTPSLAGSAFRVVAKYFEVRTEDRPGLPLQVENWGAYPACNVRIGFAACSGFDPQGRPLHRYPVEEGVFAHDLESPAAREAFWKDAQGGRLARPFVMFDVLFNLAYDPADPTLPRAGAGLSAESPRPELHRLVLPFRF